MSRNVLCVITMGLFAAQAAANDWPSWRGPENSGMSRESAVITSWSKDGENLLWQAPYGGRTTPIVMHGRLYMIGPVGEGMGLQERLVCLDAATGELIWEHRFNVFHTDIVENRIGWTSVAGDVDTGYVYVHLTGGEFYCFNGSGKIKWKHSLTEEYGRVSGYGGRLHTPVVEQQLVIISFLSSGWGNHARPLHRYVAFDKKKGDVKWWAAPGGKPLDTTYSTPAVSVINGLKTLVAGNADGNIYGMKLRTGETIWKFRLSKRGINSSVLVDSDRVFVSHSEENHDNTEMGRVVSINATLSGDITDDGELWRIDGIPVGYSSPAMANGRLYVVDNSANLHAIDAANGETRWSYNLGRVGKGSPVVMPNNVIYVAEQNGIFHILQDKGEKCESLSKTTFAGPDGLVDEIFGSPAVSNGRVYFMTRYGIYCLGLRNKNEIAGEPDRTAIVADIPRPTIEKVNSTAPPSQTMIYPAEVTLAPGERVRFAVFEFSGDTVYMNFASNLTWTKSGVLGNTSARGEFRADEANRYSAGYVTAKSDKYEVQARVRVTPKPPFTEDFESFEIDKAPPGWVGTAGKTKIVERDGTKVLRKIAPKEKPSPPLMRLRGYATPPIEGGYTVQVDVLATEKKTKALRYQADAGAINSRYRMFLMGREQVLRLETWAAIPRLRMDVPFKWKPETWYTLRLDVKLEEGKAMLRGKVWPRGTKEPNVWQIETTDTHPNTDGSAGVYGYSHGTRPKRDGTEIFYDNFKVTPN